jgi:hypothetical protein
MTTERLQQLSTLLRDLRYGFTELASALRSHPTLGEAVAAVGKFDRMNNTLREHALRYCGEDGRAFGDVISNDIGSAAQSCNYVSRSLVNRAASVTPPDVATECDALADSLDKIYERIVGTIRHVPVDWSQVAIPKGDRLAGSLFLADLMTTATHRLDIVDRYLDETPLLFMRDLPRALNIRLVTTAGRIAPPGRTGFGVALVQPPARIARSQYPNLKLIEVDQQHFHNRSIRVDDRVFALDQSIGDLSLRDSAHVSAPINTPQAHAELDAIIAAGIEIAL